MTLFIRPNYKIIPWCCKLFLRNGTAANDRGPEASILRANKAAKIIALVNISTLHLLSSTAARNFRLPRGHIFEFINDSYGRLETICRISVDQKAGSQCASFDMDWLHAWDEPDFHSTFSRGHHYHDY